MRGELGALLSESDKKYLLDFQQFCEDRNDPGHGLATVLEVYEDQSAQHEKPVLVAESAAQRIYDCGRCLGPLAVRDVLQELATIADRFGVGLAALHSLKHVGKLGYHIRRMAELGYVGIGSVVTHPTMAAFGAPGRVLGNNVLVLAAPGGDEPVVFDASLGQTSIRKLKQLSAAGKPTTGVRDMAGRPVTGADEALVLGVLAPRDNHFGSGVALLLQSLACLLTGQPPPTEPYTGHVHPGCENQAMLILARPLLAQALSLHASVIAAIECRLRSEAAPGSRLPGRKA